jgi:hypothetical protein
VAKSNRQKRCLGRYPGWGVADALRCAKPRGHAGECGGGMSAIHVDEVDMDRLKGWIVGDQVFTAFGMRLARRRLLRVLVGRCAHG